MQNLSRSCSIIIPALNEAQVISATLESARANQPLEIIVVDGGSSDGTLEIARSLADNVITSTPGRAHQQNQGAAMARGDYLLFLHADCILHQGSLELSLKRLQESGIAACCFNQHIPEPHDAFRWLEWGNRKRIEWWQMAYGDQGFCLSSNLFRELGGFPEIRLMEDVELSRRLKQHGRIVISTGVIEVNPRRWKKRGVLGQTWRNWLFVSLYRLGVSTERLERWYRQIR